MAGLVPGHGCCPRFAALAETRGDAQKADFYKATAARPARALDDAWTVTGIGAYFDDGTPLIARQHRVPD
jgi:hypothetical protein